MERLPDGLGGSLVILRRLARFGKPQSRLSRVHPGYAVSQCIRKRIEEVFGWTKTVAGQRKTRFRGLPRVRWAFTFGVRHVIGPH